MVRCGGEIEIKFARGKAFAPESHAVVARRKGEQVGAVGGAGGFPEMRLRIVDEPRYDLNAADSAAAGVEQ